MRQYFHNSPNYTISLDVPEKSVLEELIKLDTPKTLFLSVGVAFLHPHDQFYIKRIGREVADNNSLFLEYKLDMTYMDNDRMLVVLENCDEYYQKPCKITLRMMPNSDRIHFIAASL